MTTWVNCSSDELRRALEEIGVRLKTARHAPADLYDVRMLGAQLSSIVEHLQVRSGALALPHVAPRTNAMSTVLALYEQYLEIREFLLLMEMEQKQEAVVHVNDALGRLRICDTYEALATALPKAVVSLGFGRALFSRVSRMRWIAESGASIGNPSEARRMVAIGSRPPYRELRGLFEHEVVVERRAIIGSATRALDRVHPELHAEIQSQAYVAAPIEVGSHVIGFISADRSSRSGSVNEFDRELLSLLCRGTGLLLERMAKPILDRKSASKRGYEVRPPTAREYVGPDLTHREFEVARLITRGMTNKEIAGHLTIAETTAKVHVKNILQKLGASNRTEAASLLLCTALDNSSKGVSI